MPWMIKPTVRRGIGGRMSREAAPLTYPPPPDPDSLEAFMSSSTIVPEYVTGSSTTDVYVGAIYIDASGLNIRLKAVLGTTKSGTAVTLKAKTSLSTSAAAETGGTITTTSTIAECTAVGTITSAQGYYYFYLSSSSSDCSWQCAAISLVR